MGLRSLLSDYQRYQNQIDWLHVKYGQRNRLYDVKQDGVALASISLNSKKVARLLADTVGTGKYQLRPAHLRWVEVNNKQRLLYVFCLTDLIVHGVVASIINECMQPYLSPRLYSYRKGTHWWKAIADFARYVRAHRRSHQDSKTRGLYVLRRDVHQYTDSIPVDDQSPIWTLLKNTLSLDPQRDRSHQKYWSLIQGIVRPETYSEQGLLYNNIRGIPTGSPISTTLFNLYLMSLDEELGKIPGAFYARYSDDFLFAHPDPDTVRQVAHRIDSILMDKGLCTNRDKDQNLYFNGAGRPSLAWDETQGTTRISFLGCDISFDATVSLKNKKVRRLLQEVTTRAQRTLKALDDRSPAVAGPLVCRVINQALDPASPCRQKSAPLLRNAITNRQQLKQLDYHIARIVARVLTGQPGVRVFRQVAYRTMREQWQLVSLVYTRNIAARRARKAACSP